MTVTIVFGKTSDGYLHSIDANYITARTGPGDGVNSGNTNYLGQNNNGGSYTILQTFIGFDYSAIAATEEVIAAEMRISIANILNTSIATDIEWRGFAWSPGGLLTSDWRTPTQLDAARLDGIVNLTGSAIGSKITTSSDNFLTNMKSATTMEELLHTSRQRAGIAPTSDEGIATYSADQSGTTLDPMMVYTSLTRHSLFGVLGAQVQVTDGWAYLESNGSATPTITLKHRASSSGTVTTIATMPIGTSADQFASPDGAQAFALVTDPSDNLYVISRYGSATNSIGVLAYQRGGGVTWTAKTMRNIAMPSYGAKINQVAACYHGVNGGTILVIVSHNGSVGNSTTHNELSHCTVNPTVLLTNATGSTPTYMTGYSIPSLQPVENVSGYFNTYHNQVGTGLDVATAEQTGGTNSWGYVYSYGTAANLGDNRSLNEGRYILASNSASFTHTSTEGIDAWGRKDAAGKVRVVPISQTAAAFVSADSDSLYGLTVCVQNHNGSVAGSTEIGYVRLANQGISGMPDGPAVGQVSWWDVVYNSTGNSLWIYFVSTADAGIIRRTSFDLNTMQARADSVLVYDEPTAATISSVRVQRNASVGQTTLVTIATNSGGTLANVYVVDTFNVAPTAPTLTPKANFDATTAQTFAWTFNDPNPGDTQSAYQLEISRVSDGVVVLDTGKVTSTTSSRNVAGSTIANGVDYRWRVRTYDALDVVSPYSGYGTFTTSAGGTVTITVPATDYPGDVITDDIFVTWSASGTTQAAYRIWLYRGATLVSDTNWVSSTATTAVVSGMLSDQTHEIRVQLRNAGAVTTNTASRFLTPSFSTPEKPLITVQANPDDGYILVVVDNPATGAGSLGVPEEDFESGVGTWVPTAAGATVTSEGTIAHKGTKSLKLAATSGALATVSARDWGNFRPVTAGIRYQARMWVYVSATTTVNATIDWATAGFSFVSSSSFTQVVPATTWTLIQVAGVCPPTAALASYGPDMLGTVPIGRNLYLDEVNFGIASDRPDVVDNLVLRRVADSADAFEVIGEIDPDGTFRDYTATAGITYEYIARGEA